MAVQLSMGLPFAGSPTADQILVLHAVSSQAFENLPVFAQPSEQEDDFARSLLILRCIYAHTHKYVCVYIYINVHRWAPF